jgi:hypothetical protein
VDPISSPSVIATLRKRSPMCQTNGMVSGVSSLGKKLFVLFFVLLSICPRDDRGVAGACIN